MWREEIGRKMTREIQLTRGKITLIDDHDYARVVQFKWCVNKFSESTWYALRNVHIEGKGKTILLHRFIMDAPQGVQVDHINHDGLDNRRSNLRLCTKSENMRNMFKKPGEFSSIYKGVYCDPRLKIKKWTARIKTGFSLSGKSLGYYETEIEAARAYDEAARKYHGEFARLNFP